MTTDGAPPLKLLLRCTRGNIRSLALASTRPQAARLLRGRTPQQATALLPLLFNVCGRAQLAAAHAALSCAEAASTPPAETTLAAEAVQEHLWRLAIDWPQALGLTPQPQRYARWRKLLQQGDEAALAELRRGLYADWLGIDGARWLDEYPPDALPHWWRQAASPAATLLATLERLADDATACPVPLLPPLSARQAVAAFAGQWGDDLAQAPTWQGVPAETGSLALYPALQRYPSRLLARVAARVYDAIALLERRAAPRLDSTAAAAGVGVACVQTARGLLLHRVQLAAGKIGDYCIVAPTEWNFHPQGVLAQILPGMACDKAGRQQIERQVLSLDPCVEYRIEVADA